MRGGGRSWEGYGAQRSYDDAPAELFDPSILESIHFSSSLTDFCVLAIPFSVPGCLCTGRDQSTTRRQCARGPPLPPALRLSLLLLHSSLPGFSLGRPLLLAKSLCLCLPSSVSLCSCSPHRLHGQGGFAARGAHLGEEENGPRPGGKTRRAGVFRGTEGGLVRG